MSGLSEISAFGASTSLVEAGRADLRGRFLPESLLAPSLKTNSTDYQEYLANYSTYLNALEAARCQYRSALKKARDPKIKRVAAFDHYLLYTWYDAKGKVLKISKDKSKAPEGFARQRQQSLAIPVAEDKKVEPASKPEKAELTPVQLKARQDRRKAANRRQRAAKRLREQKKRLQTISVTTKVVAAQKRLDSVRADTKKKSFAAAVKATPKKKPSPTVVPPAPPKGGDDDDDPSGDEPSEPRVEEPAGDDEGPGKAPELPSNPDPPVAGPSNRKEKRKAIYGALTTTVPVSDARRGAIPKDFVPARFGNKPAFPTLTPEARAAKTSANAMYTKFRDDRAKRLEELKGGAFPGPIDSDSE